MTSNDPLYRQKLKRIQAVLSSLREDERFFSIDEDNLEWGLAQGQIFEFFSILNQLLNTTRIDQLDKLATVNYGVS